MIVLPQLGLSDKVESISDKNRKYFRVIHNISFSDMDTVAHFVDTFKDKSVDKNATELAVKLRDEKLPKAIYKRNMKRFEIDWSGMDGVNLETHKKYFTGLYQFK